MTTEITEGSRVRVAIYRKGYHKRNVVGVCRGWTPGGLCRVQEDGLTTIKAYSSEHVKLIKS